MISKTRLLFCSSDETPNPETTNSGFPPTKINLLIFKQLKIVVIFCKNNQLYLHFLVSNENSFEQIIVKTNFVKKKSEFVDSELGVASDELDIQ